MKALIYRRGGLGDTLLTFPVLEILTRKGYRLTAVGNTDYFKIAKEVGWAEEVLPEIPADEFDLKLVIGTDGNISPFPRDREWVVRHYLRSSCLEGEEFSDTLPLEPLAVSPLEGKAVLHPSSGSPKKNPPLDLFLRVEEYLAGLGFEVVYLVGEADSWLKGKVSNFVESLDPLWIGRALKKALIYVGLDSGVSHLASYVGVPSIVIYGPTDPVVWKPIGSKVFQLSLGLECSPCFPDVCESRPCLDSADLFKCLLPLLNHLLIYVS
ncbi:MAG: glycosyltransferase family 9 protein [Aquificota bacterium]|nr:glycosyltransferase family 9 protein [Aquificota bacterium]